MRISQFDFEPLPIKIKGSGKIKKDEIQSSKVKSHNEKNARSLKPMRSNSARRIGDKPTDNELKKPAFQNKKINEKEEKSQPLQNNFVTSENENVFFNLVKLIFF